MSKLLSIIGALAVVAAAALAIVNLFYKIDFTLSVEKKKGLCDCEDDECCCEDDECCCDEAEEAAEEVCEAVEEVVEAVEEAVEEVTE